MAAACMADLVADVASGQDHQPGRATAQEMTLNEIIIFTEHHSSIAIGDGSDRQVRAAIPLRKIKRLKHITTQWLQVLHERSRQLGIQRDHHAGRISTRLTRASCAAY